MGLTPVHGRLLARPPEGLAGLIELRGLGIRRLPYEPVAVVNHVVDLAADDAERLPSREACRTTISGVALPRLGIAPGIAIYVYFGIFGKGLGNGPSLSDWVLFGLGVLATIALALLVIRKTKTKFAEDNAT